MKFTNSARYREPSGWLVEKPGVYSFDEPSPYLFQWSRLLQAVVSQAGTFMLTGKFHDKECAIYKSEGGCRIDGVNQLVLLDRICYFDFGGHHVDAEDSERLRKLAGLITSIVLAFDPEHPYDSILSKAAETSGAPLDELVAAVKLSKVSAFGGDALSSFFRWNPFTKPPIDRDYRRFCLTKFGDMTDEQVDQLFADADLGDALLEKINTKLDKFSFAMCCSPRRGEDGIIRFWINTGRSSSPIDGWKTQEEIEAFVASE